MDHVVGWPLLQKYTHRKSTPYSWLLVGPFHHYALFQVAHHEPAEVRSDQGSAFVSAHFLEMHLEFLSDMQVRQPLAYTYTPP